jgi:hypothetical protein
MSDQLRWLMLDCPVRCRDGNWGKLRDLVVDPARSSVTHLVVEPGRAPASARIVAMELVRSAPRESALTLACTVAEAEKLPLAEALAYSRGGRLSSDDPKWDVGAADPIEMPDPDGGPFVDFSPQADPRIMMSYDRVPKGTVEIRQLSSVNTSDGHIAGRLEGVIVNGPQISHILVRRGSLLRRRDIALPIEAVSEIATDEVSLTVSRRELRTRGRTPVP